jgi:hypothetical protein
MPLALVLSHRHRPHLGLIEALVEAVLLQEGSCLGSSDCSCQSLNTDPSLPVPTQLFPPRSLKPGSRSRVRRPGISQFGGP